MKLISAFLLIILSSFTKVSAQNGKEYDLFIGTYTNASKTNGIHVFSFNTGTGELKQRSVTTGIANPSYLTVSSNKKQLYAVSEVGRGQAKVYAYTFNRKQGELKLLNSVPAGGDGPCYVSTEPKGKFIFAGMYSAGSLSAIPIIQDGRLGTNSQIFKYEGSSINKQNQSRSHVHSVIPSPDGKFMLVADLGTDKIHSYRYDQNKAAPLTLEVSVSVTPGSGPRHLAFHPNGKMVYAVMELSAEVLMMEYKDGNLIPKQYISMLLEGFKGEVEAADIHISPDGKFLYASNRAHGNDIVIYSISRNGQLNYAGRQKDQIRTPRGFAIDPSGNFLLVANMDGNNIVVFKRDTLTGLLSPTGMEAKVDEPVCLKFNI